MDPWTCALLISTAGAVGGIANALLNDNGFLLPRLVHGVWCPGFVSNILFGALAAFASWALYGSGAGVNLALPERAEISLHFSALAGAFVVGVAGAKWITAESDKQLLKESVKAAASQPTKSPDESEKLVQGPPRKVLERVKGTT